MFEIKITKNYNNILNKTNRTTVTTFRIKNKGVD